MSNVDFATSSKSNEWYTPEEYVERVRRVLGGRISFDPASCRLANEIVKAEVYFTLEDPPAAGGQHADALIWPWPEVDSCFCNPPYGTRSKREGWREPWGNNAGLFLKRWYYMFHDKRMFHRGIFLCNASIGDAWFNLAWDCDAICFPYRRIQYDEPLYYHEVSPDDRVEFWNKRGIDRHTPIRGAGPQPTKGNAFIYLGEEVDVFAREFCEIGRVFRGRS